MQKYIGYIDGFRYTTMAKSSGEAKKNVYFQYARQHGLRIQSVSNCACKVELATAPLADAYRLARDGEL
jgi:hypothetical protein